MPNISYSHVHDKNVFSLQRSLDLFIFYVTRDVVHSKARNHDILAIFRHSSFTRCWAEPDFTICLYHVLAHYHIRIHVGDLDRDGPRAILFWISGDRGSLGRIRKGRVIYYTQNNYSSVLRIPLGTFCLRLSEPVARGYAFFRYSMSFHIHPASHCFLPRLPNRSIIFLPSSLPSRKVTATHLIPAIFCTPRGIKTITAQWCIGFDHVEERKWIHEKFVFSHTGKNYFPLLSPWSLNSLEESGESAKENLGPFSLPRLSRCIVIGIIVPEKSLKAYERTRQIMRNEDVRIGREKKWTERKGESMSG